MNDRDKPRQGVVANTLNLFRNGAVGFIEGLGGTPTMLEESIRSSFPGLLDLDSMFVAEVLYRLDIRPHVVVE
jgi:hypothetical protein